MDEPDVLLADRYRLVRQVGRGGMGVVWEGRDERLERPVAVKVLRAQLGLSAEEAELAKNRAMREARITARLHHRYAVPVFDVVEHDGRPCLIMQYLPSVPLSAVLRESGPLGAHEAAKVGAQVASALAAAHGLDIVHRDVKPGNILVADDGTALISDFGISHALGDATLTSTGLVHGTPAYLAPEVARGADSGFASDVFSLGATLYAAVEGGPPFGSDPNSIALLYKVASGEFAPPQRAGALTPLLMEMLRSDPDARPAMKDVAFRLAAIEAGDAVVPATLALPVTPPLTELPLPEPPLPELPRPEPTPADPTPADPTPPEPAAEATGTTQVRRNAAPPRAADEPATARLYGPPAAAPPASPPLASPPPSPAPGRRRGAWAAAVVLLVALVVLATALATGRLGSGGDGTASGPAPVETSASAVPSGSPEPSSEPSETSSPSSTPSGSSTPSSTPTPSASPTATAAPGGPTADQLEDAITTYYGLVPDDTDAAWSRLTSAYQRNPSGGRQSYQRFWDQVDSVSVSKVKATPPSRVDATVTYRRGDQVSVERTSFRLVEDDGVIKINGSTVISG